MAGLWADFYDFVLPELPGLPAGAPADHYIRSAAIEFFERTNNWRVETAGQNIVAAQAAYLLTPPTANTQVTKVLEVRIEDRLLTPMGEQALVEKYGPSIDWQEVTSEKPEYWNISLPPDTIRLVGIPTANVTAGLTAQVAIVPTLAATGIDDALFRAFRTQIAALSKAMAMESARKPYSNVERAEKLRQWVNEEIGFAAYVFNKGGGRGRMRTRTHWI